MAKNPATIGIFLCDCGEQITKLLDYKQLAESARSLPNVAYVERHSALCNTDGLELLRRKVSEGGVNRIVVGSCSPKICEIRFQNAVERGGLNRNLLDVVNLRDHCAWCHLEQSEEANCKAKAMLAGAVLKAPFLEEVPDLRFPLNSNVLILGGGIAGIQAAIDLTDMGYNVNLVERQQFLGGLASQLVRFYPTDDCALCVSSCQLAGVSQTSRKCIYRAAIGDIPNLNVFLRTNIVDVKGAVGDYHLAVEKKPRYVDLKKCIDCGACEAVCPVEVPDEFNAGLVKRKAIYKASTAVYPPVYAIDEATCLFKDCGKCVGVCPTNAIDLDEKPEKAELNVGAVLLATGFEVFKPTALVEYKYGILRDVVTHQELARMIDPLGPSDGKVVRPSNMDEAKKVVMIQCVGSRDEKHYPYCPGICCMISLKHAILIKEKYPDTDVSICYIDIRTPGLEREEYYAKARELGVKFVKGKPSEVYENPETGRLTVEVEDELSRQLLELDSDLVILSSTLIPASGTDETAKMFKLDLGKDGFFKEYNRKLRSGETKLRGIYVCGCANGPKDIPSTSLNASGAAFKAAKLLGSKFLVKPQKTAVVDENVCGDCESCPVMCPYSAIELVKNQEGHLRARVSDLTCTGCGLCVSTCPVGAIRLRGWSEDQIEAQMKGLLSIRRNGEPVVLAICCDECGNNVTDAVGEAKVQYPANVRLMRVPCTGNIRVQHLLNAFSLGADAVMVVACKEDGCHYEIGSEVAERRVKMTKAVIKEMGIPPENLEIFHMVYIETDDFAKAAKTMTERAKQLTVQAAVA